ncbi:MAG: metal-dependent transcriptional regulator [Actinomycetia bacterium]|nr:metal-dependent transcriptional regulator [Actinomycetes bacterium]MCP4227409.1 metal-dependent transcriptional regulator [Actinomycetes bacterium]MCP5034185.1 metal-dependent transcriptional regulator [Actinomycetes bacterium]
MPYESPEHHPAFEEYTETIFELAEDGIDVIQARIAERLDVSRPAVSEMVKRMHRAGLVDIDEQANIALTSEGRSLATTVVRRHRVAERFLTDILRISWTDAHHEAGRWEHVISPLVEEAMMNLLDDPTTCPHGNPIPGTGYTFPVDALPLVEVGIDGGFVVERIPEELEFQDGQLAFLEQAGLLPGRQGTILSIAPDGTTTVSVQGSAVGISAFTASRILVSVI